MPELFKQQLSPITRVYFNTETQCVEIEQVVDDCIQTVLVTMNIFTLNAFITWCNALHDTVDKLKNSGKG